MIPLFPGCVSLVQLTGFQSFKVNLRKRYIHHVLRKYMPSKYVQNIGMSKILLCGLTIFSLSSLNLWNNSVALYRVSLKYKNLYATFEVGFIGQQYLKIVSIMNFFFVIIRVPKLLGSDFFLWKHVTCCISMNSSKQVKILTLK